MPDSPASPRLMAQLGRNARYSGQAPPYEDPGSLPYRAWLVWSAARLKAVDVKQEYDGIPGSLYTGALATIIWRLFPEISSMNDDEKTAFQKEIRTFLRGTRNAVCTSNNAHNPVWWIRKTWNDRINTAAPPTRYVATPAERKVTRSEAGEDRQPGEVTVRKIEGCDDPTPDTMCGIDPRWFGELVGSLRNSAGGMFSLVVGDVAKRTTPFTVVDVAESVKAVSKTNISNGINTLVDAGIVVVERVARQSGHGVIGTSWTIDESKRHSLAQVIKFANGDEPIDWYRPIDRDELLASIPNDRWCYVSEIAQIAIIVRTRLYNALQRLVERGLIEHEQEGRHSRWKRKAEVTASSDVGDVKEEPEMSPASPTTVFTDDVLAVAGIVEQIVEGRVEVATRELRTQLEAAVAENRSLKEALEPLKNLLKS